MSGILPRSGSFRNCGLASGRATLSAAMTASPSTPDEIRIPAGRRARGRLRVPSSKSLTNRYLNLALLGTAPLIVEHPLRSEDTGLFLQALGHCGFRVEEEGERVRLEPGPPPSGEVEIFCGAS